MRYRVFFCFLSSCWPLYLFFVLFFFQFAKKKKIGIVIDCGGMFYNYVDGGGQEGEE